MEGNHQKMREALLEIETVAGEAVENGTMELPQYSKIVDIAEKALSEPARNCDVGSMAEQRQRFHAYCEKMQNTDKACCGGCPIVKLRLDGTIGNSCELAWAQMPYESEAKNGPQE